MKIQVIRKYLKTDYCIGKLYIDGAYFCDTLEDTDRGLHKDMLPTEIAKIKQYGKTAIPLGEYRVTLTPSQTFAKKSWCVKFGGLVPLINKVPGFSGIRIHPGNYPEDTLGCLLVGYNKVRGGVVNSVDTYSRLMDIINDARRDGEEITISYERDS